MPTMVRWLVAALLIVTGLAGCGRYPASRPAPERAESDWSLRAVSADLPSAEQIGQIFPAHAGGRLDVGYLTPQTGDEGVCRADFVLTDLDFISGRWGSYESPGEPTAYFRGEPEPVVFVYAFGSALEAKAGLEAARAMADRCTGDHFEEGQRITTQPLTHLPSGDVGIRSHEFTDNVVTPSGVTEDFFTDVFGVKDNLLVESRIQDATSFPPSDQIADLAELATRVAGEASRPRVSEPAGARFLDFRLGDPYGGSMIETSAGVKQLKGVSAAFRVAMAEQVEQRGGQAETCVPLRVQTYRTDGFARVMFTACGYEDASQYEIWAAPNGNWRRVDAATLPESFDCKKLEAAKVPLGIALDWCSDGDEGLGTDYPRR